MPTYLVYTRDYDGVEFYRCFPTNSHAKEYVTEKQQLIERVRDKWADRDTWLGGSLVGTLREDPEYLADIKAIDSRYETGSDLPRDTHWRIECLPY